MVREQVERELAPLKESNDALQRKVDNLECGIVGMSTEMVGVRDGLKAATDGLEVASKVWQTKEFGDFFEGLLKKANTAGRAAVSGVAAPAQDARQGTNPNDG